MSHQSRNDEICPILPVRPDTRTALTSHQFSFSRTEFRKGVYSYYNGGYYTLIVHVNSLYVFAIFHDSAISNIQDGRETRLKSAGDRIIVMINRLESIWYTLIRIWAILEPPRVSTVTSNNASLAPQFTSTERKTHVTDFCFRLLRELTAQSYHFT